MDGSTREPMRACRVVGFPRTPLDTFAEWVCAPCLLAAWVLYAIVTWAPEALFGRDLLIGALVVVALGAAIARLPQANKVYRTVGATTMVAGLLAVVCIAAW